MPVKENHIPEYLRLFIYIISTAQFCKKTKWGVFEGICGHGGEKEMK